MRKLTRTLLTVLVALVGSISTFAYDFVSNGIYYNILSEEDLTCEITYVSRSGNSYSSNISIPVYAQNNGKAYKVVAIGEYAFYGCEGITTVVIPSNIKQIKGYAFQYCRNLTALTIQEGLEAIERNAFDYCSNLDNVAFPNSLVKLGHLSFKDCDSLETFTLPNHLEFFGANVFSSTKWSSNFSYDTYTYLNNGEILYDIYYKTLLNSVKINEGVRMIAGYALRGNNSKVTEITVPNSVEFMGEASIYYFKELTTLSLGSGLKTIDGFLLIGCPKLNKIYIHALTPPECLLSDPDKKYAFDNIDKENCTLYVEPEALEAYMNAPIWKEFKNIVPLDVDLNDGVAYSKETDTENVTVNYTRNFTNTNWQALYIPFPMKYEDWADKADVAYINNVHQFDDNKDGVIDRTILEFITKTSGSIEANKPYVIKPKQTGEVTFTTKNTILYAAPETDGYVDCMSTTTKYTLYGTYQEKTDMYANGYYAMADGGFKQAESASVKLSPFRTYLKIESRTDAGAVQNAKRIGIMVDGVIDNDATGIEEITENSSLETQNCYNLAGQKVGRDYKGIAIKNGKKYIIK